MPTLHDFSYHLPKKYIAQFPAEPRDSSKLLVFSRKTGEIRDMRFDDLPSLLTSNDVLVRNNTKVIPARLFGEKTTGGKIEVLLAKHLSSGTGGERWEVLTRPGAEPGTAVSFGNGALSGTCTESSGYTRVFVFDKHGQDFYRALLDCGYTPLPPYINQDFGKEDVLRTQYQTIYAKHQGSSAAPTAGLHFTRNLERKLEEKGVQTEELTLHVGLGTFLPVKTENIEDHTMHSEWFSLSKETTRRLNNFKREGKRIIAVGTTSVRVLESCADLHGILHSKEGETNIFIYPPSYRFTFADALITNFHMPESTLLMLISAFCSAPNTEEAFTSFQTSRIGQAYEHAKKHRYRFFSFGDAMLIQ